jgi:NitT/TauT family transport system substrate-binding protein
MDQIRIEFSRFSAFYSPLILTMAGGFLEREGLEYSYTVSTPARTATDAVLDGSVDVVQSAVAAAFPSVAKGKQPDVVHFAQINETDGFFLMGRQPDPNFSWSNLAGKNVLVDHGGQPMAMFKYGCLKAGLDYGKIFAIDAGSPEEMEAAFRSGEGDYIHAQGPVPQQLQQEGIGQIVASIGETIGVVAFSTLAAKAEWLETDMAAAFMRAYRAARKLAVTGSEGEIAKLEAGFFPGIDSDALAETIAFYQKLGCWTPHLDITREAFEVAVDVFLHSGAISQRLPYDLAVYPVPGE